MADQIERVPLELLDSGLILSQVKLMTSIAFLLDA